MADERTSKVGATRELDPAKLSPSLFSLFPPVHFNCCFKVEACAGEFLRRVDAELAAADDFAGRVVEHVGRLHFFTKGLRTLSCGKAEKSRSADHSSLTP